MANYSILKAAIQQVIKTNGNNEITGALLQQSLLAMIDSLGSDFHFCGIASEDTNPGTPDANVSYIAGSGTYPNFGGAVVPYGSIGVFLYNGGDWVIQTTPIGKDYDEDIDAVLHKLNPLYDDYINENSADPTLPAPLNYYITDAGKWSTNNAYKHCEMDVRPGTYIRVVAGTGAAYVSFLKTNTRVAGGDVDVCDDWVGIWRAVIPAGTTQYFKAPADAQYFYYYRGRSADGYPYTPAAIVYILPKLDSDAINESMVEVETLREDVGETVIVTETTDCSQTTWVSGNILAVSGSSMGATGTSTANSHSDYIELAGVGAYERILRYTRGTTTNSSSNAGLVFYDKNKNALDFQKMVVNAAQMGYVIEDLPVPQDAKYFRTTIRNEDVANFYANLTIRNKQYTSGLGKTVDGLVVDVEELKGLAPGSFKPYNVVGSPQPFIPTIDTAGLSVFNSVDSLNAAFDNLAALYPDWLKREADIGMDASGVYPIRHYTLRFQHPLITNDRAGDGTNLWSDTQYKYRRIIVNMSIHSTEKYSTLGGYLAIKMILESNDPWAKFIKDNFVLDIVPCLNPWGLANNSSNNYNGKNLNRTFFTDVQAENTAMINLIADLKNKGLVGVIDLHNTGLNDAGGNSYLVSKPTYKFWNYYAVLVQQLQALLYDFTEQIFGTSRDNHFHLWDGSENSGQLHQYANYVDILGGTVEVSTGQQITGSFLTVAQVINIINAFGMFTNV